MNGSTLSAKARLHGKFLGRKVVGLMVAGVATGILLGVVEVVFAYVLQIFLVAIGVLQAASASFPAWLPSFGLARTLLLLAGAGVARGLLQGLNYYLQGGTMEEVQFEQRSRLMSWALHSESASTSQVTSLFNARAVGAGSVVYSIQGLLVQVPIIVLLAAALLAISWKVTLAASAALAMLAPPLLKLDDSIKKRATSTIVEWDQANARLVMSIKNLLLLQIYGTQAQEDRRAQQNLATYRRDVDSLYRMTAVKIAVPQVAGLIVVALIALVAHRGQLLAAGILTSYFYLFLRLIQCFSAANQAYSSLLFGLPHYQVLMDWWTQARQERSAAPSRDAGSDTDHRAMVRPGWRLTRLTFRYPGATQDAVSDLSLELAPGSSTVITGPSGAGKSTLLGLLLGNLKPTAGRIELLLDGRSEALEAARADLLPCIGYVGPESFLVEGTVYENVVYGFKQPPSADAVERALSLAECGFVRELPQGLQHRLTEQGQGLSAGQKQRLSLARALLREPIVLILDEATSNLDMETEQKLVETLSRLKGSMTVIAVTHRRALLALADSHIELGSGAARAASSAA